ncbi:unnamed protein product, partial [Allacma fusca]
KEEKLRRQIERSKLA